MASVKPFLLPLALTVLACDTDDSQTAPQGELAQGTFAHECALPSDVYCSKTNAIDSFLVTRDFGNRKALPIAVAAASLFELRYLGSESIIDLRPASDLDAASSGLFSIETPAFASFLAWGEKERVIDFATLEAREVSELTVWANQIEAHSLELEEGDNVAVTVAPLDKNGTLLGGALPYEWLSQDTEVIKLSGLGDETPVGQVRNLCDVRFTAESLGTALVTLKSGKISKEIEVTVR